MNESYKISSNPVSVQELYAVVNQNRNITLSEESRHDIVACRQYLEDRLEKTNDRLYGVNTGFGSLYSKDISKDQLEQLQENLVLSHALGAGEEIPEVIVKSMILLKIQSLAYGHSGIQIQTVERLMDFYNQDILPVVYEFGSLGASGDLAPLAHMSLPLIGHGEVSFGGSRISGKDLLSKMGWDPIQLRAKEGLALLNGTQFMTAYGVWCIVNGWRIYRLANLLGALSLDVFDGRIEPFEKAVQSLRPHPGQSDSAQQVREILKGSELISGNKEHVQDPYSFRCIPQVHGATHDAFVYIDSVFTNEINSVTDNPLIFPADDRIISAGNFHGQPLALALDFLCIALSELGNISERRTYQLLSGGRNLPNYLVAKSGINSGLMIAQYTAASMVSKNKELCSPSSVDSIVTSNGQEDHNSMGANAATKTYKLVMNVYSILAIELMCAAQALDFRRPKKTSPWLESFIENFRSKVPFIDKDRVLHGDLIAAEEFIKTAKLELEEKND